MIAWVRGIFTRAPVPGSSNPMPDQQYWDNVLQTIADIRVWLSTVEANIPSAAYRSTAKPETMSVDEEVAAADSPTRVQKALEREFGVDRRTIYQRVERIVHAYQLERTVPDWRANVDFWKSMADRGKGGQTRMAFYLAALDSKVTA